MAYEYYLTIEGTIQGKFKGGSSKPGFHGKSPILQVQHSVESPLDSNQGGLSGKRQHQPFHPAQWVGQASPQPLAVAAAESLLGGSSKPGFHGKSPILQVQMGVESPVDSTQGGLSGKRQHQPLPLPGSSGGKHRHRLIGIIKEVDMTSPQLLLAHTNSEILKSVVIEIVEAGAGGSARVLNTITLWDATIRDLVRQHGGPAMGTGKNVDLLTFEFADATIVPGPRPRLA